MVLPAVRYISQITCPPYQDVEVRIRSFGKGLSFTVGWIIGTHHGVPVLNFSSSVT